MDRRNFAAAGVTVADHTGPQTMSVRLFSPDLGKNLGPHWRSSSSAPSSSGGRTAGFRYAQLVTFGTMALGHGMQDAQQTMRSIPLALIPQVGAASRLAAVRWSAVGAVAHSITNLFVG